MRASSALLAVRLCLAERAVERSLGISYAPSDVACVANTGGEGLRIHASPLLTAPVACNGLPSDAFSIISGPVNEDNYTWWQLENAHNCSGWGVGEYLTLCGGNATRWNRFGLGLVSSGDASMNAYVSNLAGKGGWILLVFPGVTNTTQGPPADWVAGVSAAYAAGLNPVVRIGPPWGDTFYRDMADDAGNGTHLVYTTLASAFKAAVSGLPRPVGTRLWVQIDNEVDLCYEWACGTNEGGSRPFSETATEYAHMLSDTIAALRTLGDDGLLIGAAPMSPGGNVACGCCGSENCPGDAPGITGLQFQAAMAAAVPSLWSSVDFLASHAYPASGIGYGFNAPMPEALPGLLYYRMELAQINRSVQVLLTETGWATKAPGLPPCSEQDKADWTIAAYETVWLNDTAVAGVMPFMLMDPTWGDQDGWEYVTMSGAAQPVFGAVQQLRQQYFP